tara:strand:- start:278 stop:661 length:384 start_codon:yes stop_codon:yes gene_type:complete
MLDPVKKINIKTKRLCGISTNLFTPVQHLERMDGTHNEYLEIIKSTPVLIGMFSDKFENSNTIFQNCILERDITNGGGNWTYFVKVKNRRIEIETGMMLVDLALKFSGELDLLPHAELLKTLRGKIN